MSDPPAANAAQGLRDRQSELLDGMRRLNERRKAALNGAGGGCRLDVLTYNAGLLSAPFAAVPSVHKRGSLLPRALLEQDADIVLLQEVWNIRYKRALVQELPDYEVIYRGRSHRGLVTLVRKSLFGDEQPQIEELVFGSQRHVEHVIYKKSALCVDVPLQALGVTLHVVNFHLAAGNRFNGCNVRSRQARQLYERLLQPRIEAAAGHLIFGGDLNATPYTAQDAYTIRGKSSRNWHRNIRIYNELVSLAGGVDSFAAVHGDAEIDAAHAPNGGGIDWATQDCNNLLASLTLTTRSEPSQRVDFVFVRPLGPGSTAVIHGAEIGMKKKWIAHRVGETELSDHYSYKTKLTLY